MRQFGLLGSLPLFALLIGCAESTWPDDELEEKRIVHNRDPIIQVFIRIIQ